MNVVFVPLEGVSQTLFWQYRADMPTLWNMSVRAMSFRHFYTSSTSSLQSFCDFAFGNSTELDHNLAYPSQAGCLAGNGENLFSIIRRNGHAVLGIQHGDPCPDFAENSFYGAWPEECGAFQCHREYASFDAAAGSFLEQCAATGTPFALYYSDRAVLVDDDCPEKRDVKRLAARMRKGYALLDESVRRLVDKLNSLNLFDNTMIVAVGMYGTDMWKHGTHMGRIRAVEPYADTAWTPMFMYFNDQNITIADQLVSLIDIKPTVLKILFPQVVLKPASSQLHGINILESSRSAAFSQNLFALEREDHGSATGLVKSYAITDGNQRLMATSDAGVEGKGGLELFYDLRDPGNTRNFLDFFDMDNDGSLRFTARPSFRHSHFISSFRRCAIIDLFKSYLILRRQLMDFVKLKEKNALARSGGKGKKNLFPIDAFNRKRPRQ